MFLSRLFLVALMGLVVACSEQDSPQIEEEAAQGPEAIGRVEALAPSFEDLIDLDAEVEVLSSGYAWSEGPVWMGEEVGLLFSDVPGNTIHQWKPGAGTTEWLTPSGYTGAEERQGGMGSNGLTVDPEGNLILTQHGDRRIARLTAPLSTPEPEFETIVDAYDGKAFNSPNDLVYGPDGSIYFTDPPYGLVSPDAAELAFNGVFRLAPDGEVTLIDDSLTRPNGIALSPDHGTLYVANSDPEAALWMAYDVNADGEVSNGRLFFDATDRVSEENPGYPDGLKVDTEGRIWATGPGGVWVFSPEAEALGLIRTDGPTANLAFGEDGSTLFLTSNAHLGRIETKVTGQGF